jgi:hypothetical protein
VRTHSYVGTILLASGQARVLQGKGPASQLFSLLWQRAASCFNAGTLEPASNLFAAALQFAQPHQRSRAARMLAACNLKMGRLQVALDYVSMADRQEVEPMGVTRILKLQILLHMRRSKEAAEGEPCCPDTLASAVQCMSSISFHCTNDKQHHACRHMGLSGPRKSQSLALPTISTSMQPWSPCEAALTLTLPA